MIMVDAVPRRRARTAIALLAEVVDRLPRALGSSAPLADARAKSPVPSHVLGDARKVSNIMFAIWDAFEIATEL